MFVVHSVGDVAVQAGYILETREIEDYELVYFPKGTKSIYEIDEQKIPVPDLPLPIAQAIAYMDERLAEPITIEEIAAQSGWSNVSLPCFAMIYS